MSAWMFSAGHSAAAAAAAAAAESEPPSEPPRLGLGLLDLIQPHQIAELLK